MKKKIIKNGKTFYVNSSEKSFLKSFRKAYVNFMMSFQVDSIWNRVENDNWEKETFKIFDRFLDDKHSYIDIGAWIGPTVLYGCQIASHCYAVEADPAAYSTLESNLNLNPNFKNKVTVYEGAMSDNNGKTSFGTSSTLGDAMSSMFKTNTTTTLVVDCIAFDSFIEKFNVKNCNFIKMDIEGGELFVLPTMKNYVEMNKPTIHLSLHPFIFPNRSDDIKKIIEFMSLYRNIYSNKGSITTSDEVEKILLKRKMYDIVLTDLTW